MSVRYREIASKCVIVLLLFAMSGVQAEPRLRPASWAYPVIGTHFSNLYKIDNGVYRSEQPDEEAVNDLQQLGVREILNLREYHRDDGEVGKSAFILERVQMNAGTVTEKQVVQALKIIKNRKGPILIHCWHGSDRTGVTVAAYRIIFNNWTKSQALDEMIHGGYGYHAGIYPNLVALVKDFNINKMRGELGLSVKN